MKEKPNNNYIILLLNLSTKSNKKIQINNRGIHNSIDTIQRKEK
jgi:DNA-binding protein